MTDDVKLFVRPKVRFCQTDTNESTVGESERTIDQKNIGQSNKPKIISIVTLDKPVKLLKSNKSCNNQGDKNLKTFDNTRKNDMLTVCTNAPSLYTHDKNPIETETQKPLSDNTNITNIKANSKDTKSKIYNKCSHNDIVPSSVSATVQDKNLNKAVKSQNYVKTNASKYYIKNKKGKENEMLDAKGQNYLTKKCSNLEITNHKTKFCPTRTTSKKVNATSKTLAAFKRNLSTKSNVMPCHKYLKAASKVKSSPVKKTVIRDAIGPKIKPYIGPGVSRKKHDLKTSETDERTFMKPSISGEKLARPEYNSIMCTINKLNEMKKQKIVTDIEHLPAWYKHFINGKISTALDFPLDETIYKNLVDLSVDESQLPCRLIRSKDPEPRQKDAVPILSDFFIPMSTEEYCTSVSNKPRTPEVAEIWNAFRVSDKIFEWKHILDHV